MKTSQSAMWKWCAGLSLALGLMVAVPQAQAAYSGSGVFTQITSRAQLTDGYYVLVASNSSAALNNVNVGTFFTSAAVTVSSGKITDPAGSVVWLIQTNATYGGHAIFNEASNKYVSYAGTANASYPASAVNGTTGTWTFALASGAYFSVGNVASSARVLQYNASTPRFACYSSAQAKLAMYRLIDSVSAPAVTTVAASDIAATAIRASTSTRPRWREEGRKRAFSMV